MLAMYSLQKYLNCVNFARKEFSFIREFNLAYTNITERKHENMLNYVLPHENMLNYALPH